MSSLRLPSESGSSTESNDNRQFQDNRQFSFNNEDVDEPTFDNFIEESEMTGSRQFRR